MGVILPSVSRLRTESRPAAMGLIVVGAGLGMYLNFYFGNIGWNNYLMFIALLLLPNWRNLLNFRLPFVVSTFKHIICFQFLCILYMVIGSKFDTSGLIFLLFPVFMLIGLMSQGKNDLNMSRVIFYSWLFGWLCLIFCGLSLGTGAYFIEDAKAHSGAGFESILVDLTMAGNLCTFALCCFYYTNGLKLQRISAYIGIALSLIFILILGKRTPLVVTIFSLVVFYLKFHSFSRKIKKTSIAYTILFFIALCALFQIPGLAGQFTHVIERTIGGITDMITGSSSTGQAAVARYELRNWAIDYIQNRFTPFNLIFGAGYMTRWLDTPLLQAYLDMGVIGICVYVYYVIFRPLKITFSRISSNRIVFWACTLNFYNILSAVNSGIPYSHLRWIPLIVLILSIKKLREQKNAEIT